MIYAIQVGNIWNTFPALFGPSGKRVHHLREVKFPAAGRIENQ